MFSKVLVANRGEIALRIMRTCERLGIATVAVYSDADWNAPHVRRAQAAVRLGPPQPSQSYLNLGAIIDAAHRTGADAIHPGYGFLSEQPAFAEACASAAIAFIGPPPTAMRLLGDKLAARHFATTHGVPVIPGQALVDSQTSWEDLESVGFPLMIKAAAGGGGRGMRLVLSPNALDDAIASARREAQAAFGDGRLFIERAILGGRHLEVQILADRDGNVMHLGERDCSAQRRHQKVIEESPAPGVDASLRQRLCEAAVTIARAAGYHGAGTIEFLVDRDAHHYFLEANARLQVEHPVTEMLTGIDIVEQQIRIAAGEALSFDQRDIRPSGHAIECRITAEDPERGFVPMSGRVAFVAPPSGDGIRFDAGIESGSGVPPEYDPLLAKLIVHRQTRATAIEACRRALASMAIDGIATNLGLLECVLDHDAFVSGTHDLSLLESMPASAFAAHPPDEALVAAAVTDMMPEHRVDPWRALGPWRAHGPARLMYAYHGRPYPVEIERNDLKDSLRIQIDGRVYDVQATRDGNKIVVEHEGCPQRWTVSEERGHLFLESAHGTRLVLSRLVRPRAGQHGQAGAGSPGRVCAPMPGVVIRVMADVGDPVSARQPLAVVEAMKMEHVVESSSGGVVLRRSCEPGLRVAEGDILFEVGPVQPDATP